MLMGRRSRPRQGDLVKKRGKGAKQNLAKSSDTNHGGLKSTRFWRPTGTLERGCLVRETAPFTAKTGRKIEAARHAGLLLLVKTKIWFRAEAKARLDSPWGGSRNSGSPALTGCPRAATAAIATQTGIAPCFLWMRELTGEAVLSIVSTLLAGAGPIPQTSSLS